MDSIIEKLIKKYKVVILPRNKEQINYFKNDRFKGVIICEVPMLFETILKECKLFIGAGGSMTRELAFYGVPTISVYQGKLLSVDNYLIKNKYMKHFREPKIENIQDIINNFHLIDNSILLKEGKIAFGMIDDKLKKLINNSND